MDLKKVYRDAEGNECNVLELVKREPEWAANALQSNYINGQKRVLKDLLELLKKHEKTCATDMACFCVYVTSYYLNKEKELKEKE